MANALGTTTLAQGVSSEDTRVKVLSAAGLTAGIRLFIDRELMSVVSLSVSDALGTWVNVKRGVDGTQGDTHAQASPILTGQADWFYSVDPRGLPSRTQLVTPYVNAITGDIWDAVRDVATNNNVGYWSKRVDIHDIGAFGVRTDTRVSSGVTQN